MTLTIEQAVNLAAQENGYDNIGDVIIEEGELKKVITSAITIYAEAKAKEALDNSLKEAFDIAKKTISINEKINRLVEFSEKNNIGAYNPLIMGITSEEKLILDEQLAGDYCDFMPSLNEYPVLYGLNVSSITKRGVTVFLMEMERFKPKESPITKRWVNVYLDGDDTTYDVFQSKEAADESDNIIEPQCKRIGCVEQHFINDKWRNAITQTTKRVFKTEAIEVQRDENGTPRRNQLNKFTAKEMELYDIMQNIEKLGAHPLLTDVINLIDQARYKLADWVELPNTIGIHDNSNNQNKS